jgi:hypothetical protein
MESTNLGMNVMLLEANPSLNWIKSTNYKQLLLAETVDDTFGRSETQYSNEAMNHNFIL